MVRILAFLWSGCWHKWAIINQARVFDGGKRDDMPTYHRYFLQCERCGKVRSDDL